MPPSSPASDSHPDAHRANAASRGVGVSAAITFVSLAVFLMVVMRIMGHVEDRAYHDASVAVEDVGSKVFVAVLVQIAATGLMLAVWKPSRRLGLGLLIGALSASAVLVALMFLFVITVGS